ARVTATTAPFVAVYAEQPGNPTVAVVDPTNTIEEPSARYGTARLVIMIGASTFVFHWRSTHSIDVFSSGCGSNRLEVWTIPCSDPTPPPAGSTSPAAVSQSSRPTIPATARPPPLKPSPPCSFSRPRSRPTSITAAPADPRARAVAAPMPELAPVT